MAEDTRTPEEIEASIRKSDAETEKIRLEHDRLKVETRKLLAEAQGEEYEALGKKVAYDMLHYNELKRQTSDEMHRVYRFNSEFGDGSVTKCIDKLTQWSRMSKDPIEIVFSSPGGSVTPGFALFDYIQLLRGEGIHVTTGTVGMAASMAGILLQAGDTRWMGESAWLLIHRVSFGAVGSSFEVEDRVKWIKRIESRVIDIFTSRSDGKLSKQKIVKNWNRADWWLDANDALELGIVDEVRAGLLQ